MSYNFTTTLLFLMFILAVWASISSLDTGLIFQSFIAMLEAIWILFLAYNYLSNSLKDSLVGVMTKETISK